MILFKFESFWKTDAPKDVSDLMRTRLRWERNAIESDAWLKDECEELIGWLSYVGVVMWISRTQLLQMQYKWPKGTKFKEKGRVQDCNLFFYLLFYLFLSDGQHFSSFLVYI